MTRSNSGKLVWLGALMVTVLMITSCTLPGQRDDPRVDEAGGSIERGRDLMRTNGCVACHSVSGVPSVANGYGPDLDGFGGQRLIAGSLDNTPENLVAFLMNPGEVVEGTNMPNVGLTEEEARDIASWLYGQENRVFP